mmetsp:Transcript_65813/g.150839  ORF Transcript_65813/g.150839 Transcript_65813/m.150839 type:complete len:209 (-) Transcript_65813:160-786(-)
MVERIPECPSGSPIIPSRLSPFARRARIWLTHAPSFSTVSCRNVHGNNHPPSATTMGSAWTIAGGRCARDSAAAASCSRVSHLEQLATRAIRKFSRDLLASAGNATATASTYSSFVRHPTHGTRSAATMSFSVDALRARSLSRSTPALGSTSKYPSSACSPPAWCPCTVWCGARAGRPRWIEEGASRLSTVDSPGDSARGCSPTSRGW